MENPFKFDTIVTGEHFCNRQGEMDFLHERIRERVKVTIVSPRKFGKTSLIINTVIRYEIPHIYIDMATIDDERSFIEALLQELSRKSPLEKFRNFLQNLKIDISLNLPFGTLDVKNFGEQTVEKIIVEILKNRTLILDEFQEVIALGKTFTWKLRSILQKTPGSVIFSGSRRSIMLNLFNDPKQPFYRLTDIFHLKIIPYEEWRDFAQFWFNKTGVPVSESEIRKSFETAKGIPFYMQYILHYLWEGKRQGMNLDEVIENLLKTNHHTYEYIFESLPHSQRKALILLAVEGRESYSRETLEKYDFPTPQHLQKALRSLWNRELIEKNSHWWILDPLFALWIRKNFYTERF